MKRRIICTKSKIRNTTVFLAGLAFFMYSVTLFTNRVIDTGSVQTCVVLTSRRHVNAVITLFDVLLGLALPFFIIVVLNILIICKISNYRLIRIRKTQLAVSANSIVLLAQLKLTKLIIFISSLFLLFQLPVNIMRMRSQLMTFLNTRYIVTEREFYTLSIFQFLYYTHFTFNLFLYGVWSKKYRKALHRLISQIRNRLTGRNGHRYLNRNNHVLNTVF